MNKDTKFKDYLGDGLYADFDGYQLVLTSENGIAVLDRVCLEPNVYAALLRYVERIRQEGAFTK